MNQEALDFKELPRVVRVSNGNYLRFVGLCRERAIHIQTIEPKHGYYRLLLSAPIQDDMIPLIEPDPA